jgi:DNA-binding transcriptional regulator YbjK
MPKESATVRGTARNAILTATLLIVAEEGVDAVTHRRVAARAGVSLGSTTHHFSSREALLRETFRLYLQHADEALDALRQVVEDRREQPMEAVRSVLVGLVDREFAHASLVRAEYELLLFASRDDELAAVASNWESRAVGSLAEALERAGAERPITAGQTLVNFVRGFELERLVKPTLSLDDFDRRLTPLLAALCREQHDGRRGSP